jgi:ATP-dependent DNA helicase RecQ
VVLREPREATGRGTRRREPRAGSRTAEALQLEGQAQVRFQALKAWRGEVAREHNLPAYVVFHDATLADMAREQPASLDALAGIAGVGAKKLQAYGEQILRVLRTAA